MATAIVPALTLDLERPQEPQSAPAAQKLGSLVLASWSASADTCSDPTGAACLLPSSPESQLVSGIKSYIVRVQSVSDPTIVFYAPVDAPALAATVDVSSAGLPSSERWRVAVASRDSAGNRSPNFSFQTQTTNIGAGADNAFGEQGGFRCTASGRPGGGGEEFALLVLLAGGWFWRLRKHRGG